jgi:hypothetical protein
MEKAESAPSAGKPSLTYVDTGFCCDDTSDTHGDDKCEGEEDRSHGVYLFLRGRLETPTGGLETGRIQGI